MKRKIFCLLLAMCTILAGVANAASIGIEELRATIPERWQQTYTAHGREISVNVTIETPEVSAFPLVTVRKPAEKLPDSALERFSKIDPNIPGNIGGRIGKDFNNVADAGSVKQKQWDTYLNGETPTTLPENNPINYEDALQTVTELIGELTGLTYQKEYTLTELRVRGRYYQYANKKGEERWGKPKTDLGYYDFFFEPRFFGIPCPAYNTQGDIGYMAVTYANEGSMDLTLLFTQDATAVYEDVPLCSFDEVQKVLEADIQAGLLRSIESIQLCYVPFQDPKDASLLWLTPTWKVLGIYADNAQHEFRTELDEQGNTIVCWNPEVLCIPAQSPQLFRDPSVLTYGSKEVPVIATWESLEK